MSIPSIIGALFHDINIKKYFKSDDLRFIANKKPCDKKLDKCVYLNRDCFYKISTYIESGAMGNLSHDTGERTGLGRLVGVMSFNNRNYKLDPS